MDPTSDPLVASDLDYNQKWAADGIILPKAYETVENLKNKQLQLLKLIRDSANPSADLFS